MLKRVLYGFLGLVVILLIALGAIYALTWQSALPALASPPPPNSFDQKLVAKGAQLAAMGDCAVCHTVPGGKPYAGGLPIASQFGTLYSTNITPDHETGIGTWSEEAFRRALHQGVGRKGTHYYPAFPFDHFTKVSDADVQALYAFLMTREPVRQSNKPAALTFPLNWRVFARAWQLFFLDRGRYQPVASRGAEWNRGAYLVEGLGHCGACHSPRGPLGNEQGGANRLGGGFGENWRAPALNASSPAPVPWTAEQLYTYLRGGFADQHGVAAGPMQPVVLDLRKVPDDDVRAIAAYLVTVEGPQDPAAREKQMTDALAFARQRTPSVGARQGGKDTVGAAPANDGQGEGAAIFAGACASCHHEGGQLPVSRPVPLAMSSTLNEPEPTNFVRIVLNGIHPPVGAPGPIMPGFAGALTDKQIDALAAYARAQFSRKPAWNDVQTVLNDARKQ